MADDDFDLALHEKLHFYPVANWRAALYNVAAGVDLPPKEAGSLFPSVQGDTPIDEVLASQDVIDSAIFQHLDLLPTMNADIWISDPSSWDRKKNSRKRLPLLAGALNNIAKRYIQIMQALPEVVRPTMQAQADVYQDTDSDDDPSDGAIITRADEREALIETLYRRTRHTFVLESSTHSCFNALVRVNPSPLRPSTIYIYAYQLMTPEQDARIVPGGVLDSSLATRFELWVNARGAPTRMIFTDRFVQAPTQNFGVRESYYALTALLVDEYYVPQSRGVTRDAAVKRYDKPIALMLEHERVRTGPFVRTYRLVYNFKAPQPGIVRLLQVIGERIPKLINDVIAVHVDIDTDANDDAKQISRLNEKIVAEFLDIVNDQHYKQYARELGTEWLRVLYKTFWTEYAELEIRESIRVARRTAANIRNEADGRAAIYGGFDEDDY